MSAKLRLTFLLLLSVLTAGAQCPYDMDGDGDVGNGADPLAHYGWFGTDSVATDHNGNGITDMEDVLDYRLHFGQNCPVTTPPPATLVSGLVTQVFHLHTDSLISGPDTIPAGAITYRVYAEMLDSQVTVAGVFGTAEAPLTLSTSSAFWSSTIGEPSGIANSELILFADLFPGYAYDTYVSFGGDPNTSYNSANYWSFLGNPEDLDMEAAFHGGNQLTFDQPAGGGWINYTDLNPVVVDDLHLIGQFTVLDGGSIEGQLNLEVYEGSGTLFPTGYERAYNLTFSSAEATELGCTDPSAENYSVTAVIDDGSCTYFGDLDDDGDVDLADILEIIGNFGCTTCGDLDLDGDGVVGAADLMLLLGLI